MATILTRSSRSPLAIGISGASGRFGSALATAAEQRGWTVCWRRNRSGITSFALPAVLFDCSSPQAVRQAIQAALALGIPLVVATSGADWLAHPVVRAAATRVPVVVTGNLSRAHRLMLGMARLACDATTTARVTVIDREPTSTSEMPSATALQLAAVSGTPRIVADRSGPGVAEHHVVLAWEGETLEIHHRVTSLLPAVRGALAVVEQAAQLTRPGLYAPGVDGTICPREEFEP